MRLHKLLDLRRSGAPHQVVQERLVGIHRVNASAEFPRERQRLATRTATGIDDDTKRLSRKKAQDMQSMDVATWAEHFHPAEEQADWIGYAHVLLDDLVPNDQLACRRRTRGA